MLDDVLLQLHGPDLVDLVEKKRMKELTASKNPSESEEENALKGIEIFVTQGDWSKVRKARFLFPLENKRKQMCLIPPPFFLSHCFFSSKGDGARHEAGTESGFKVCIQAREILSTIWEDR